MERRGQIDNSDTRNVSPVPSTDTSLKTEEAKESEEEQEFDLATFSTQNLDIDLCEDAEESDLATSSNQTLDIDMCGSIRCCSGNFLPQNLLDSVKVTDLANSSSQNLDIHGNSIPHDLPDLINVTARDSDSSHPLNQSNGTVVSDSTLSLEDMSTELQRAVALKYLHSRKTVPIQLLHLLTQKEKLSNMNAFKIIDEYSISATVEYSDPAYSIEDRKNLPRVERSWTAEKMPFPVIAFLERKGLHHTWLGKELGKSETWCSNVTERFVNDGKTAIGYCSLADKDGLKEADVIIVGVGSFVPLKEEDILWNATMSIFQHVMVRFFRALGFKIIILNFDCLQLEYPTTLGNDLKQAGVKDHPEIQKMIQEGRAFGKAFLDDLGSEIMDVIAKNKKQNAEMIVVDYSSENTINHFRNNKPIDTLMEVFEKKFGIKDTDCFRFTHWAYFAIVCNNGSDVTSPIFQSTVEEFEKIRRRIGGPNPKNVDIQRLLNESGIHDRTNKTLFNKIPVDYRVWTCSEEERKQVTDPSFEFKSMSLTELEVWAEEKGFSEQIPEGKVLRDVLRECVEKDIEIVIGDSRLHVGRSDSCLRKFILMKFHNCMQCSYKDPNNPRCEEFGIFDNGLCDNHRSFEGRKQCLYRESMNVSRCEEFGMFDNGFCDNHKSLEGRGQCTYVVDPTFKFFTADSRCRKFGTFEKGRCEDHDGIIQCPINGAHTGSALSLFGQEELTHGAFYEFECPSTECRQNGNVGYRFCGKCTTLIIAENFTKVDFHPCAKYIDFCTAKNSNGSWCNGILTPVHGQLTDLLKCDSPDCPRSGIRYRFCGKCDKHVRVKNFRIKEKHPCAKDILFCNNKSLGEHTVDHMGSILTPVDDQELTHGVILKCSFSCVLNVNKVTTNTVVDVESLFLANNFDYMNVDIYSI